MKKLLTISFLIISIGCWAQSTAEEQPMPDELAFNNQSGPKTFSNSESPDFSFTVRSNVKDNELLVETDYEHEYKVRFIDYYARTSIVYKNMHSDKKIDLSDLEKSIFIVKFVDQCNNKVLSSQILNLKKKLQ